MEESVTVIGKLPEMKELLALSAPLLHGLIAIWGLLDCFFGLKIFKATVRILMAFIGATIAATLAMHMWPESVTALLVCSGVGLVLGILLGWYVWKMGLVLMAVMAGFIFASPLAAQLSPAMALLVPCAIGLVCGLLVFVILEPAVIGSTAVTGSFRLVYGAAFFIGGPNLYDYVSGEKTMHDLLVGGDWRLALATLLIAAMGAYLQFHFWRKGKAPAKQEE